MCPISPYLLARDRAAPSSSLRSVPRTRSGVRSHAEAIVGGSSALGRTTAVLAVHTDHSQGQIGCRGILAGCGEKRAFRRGGAATLLRHLEPALHRLGSLEQRVDLIELLAGERAHRAAHPVTRVDAVD